MSTDAFGNSEYIGQNIGKMIRAIENETGKSVFTLRYQYPARWDCDNEERVATAAFVDVRFYHVETPSFTSSSTSDQV